MPLCQDTQRAPKEGVCSQLTLCTFYFVCLFWNSEELNFRMTQLTKKKSSENDFRQSRTFWMQCTQVRENIAVMGAILFGNMVGVVHCVRVLCHPTQWAVNNQTTFVSQPNCHVSHRDEVRAKSGLGIRVWAVQIILAMQRLLWEFQDVNIAWIKQTWGICLKCYWVSEAGITWGKLE